MTAKWKLRTVDNILANVLKQFLVLKNWEEKNDNLCMTYTTCCWQWSSVLMFPWAKKCHVALDTLKICQRLVKWENIRPSLLLWIVHHCLNWLVYVPNSFVGDCWFLSPRYSPSLAKGKTNRIEARKFLVRHQNYMSDRRTEICSFHSLGFWKNVIRLTCSNKVATVIELQVLVSKVFRNYFPSYWICLKLRWERNFKVFNFFELT